MSDTLQTRIYQNWFYAGATAAVFLLAMLPLLWTVWQATLLIVFVQLPIYMLHQVEEYYGDRFRQSLNIFLGGGREVLTPRFVLLVNLAGVWLVDLLALYLACFIRPGLGLIAIYLAIVNAFMHLAVAVIRRSYNPGLITAMILLLPAGLVGWQLLHQTHEATSADHVWGLGVALGVHALIAIHLFRRLRVLKRSPASESHRPA